MRRIHRPLLVVPARRLLTTWDPGQLGPHMTLANGNLGGTYTGISDSNNGSLRGFNANLPGPRQFEVLIGAGASNAVIVGVGTAAALLNNFPGQNSNSWGYYGLTGNRYTNLVNSAWGASYTAGDYIAGLMVPGSIFVFKNGALQGGGAMYSNLPLGGLLPMWGPGTDTGTFVCTVNFGATPFKFPIAGALPWDA